jgi:hypothetical protein
MKVHVFPGWFQPVAIQVAGLVAGGEKAADPLIIGGVLIRTGEGVNGVHNGLNNITSREKMRLFGNSEGVTSRNA